MLEKSIKRPPPRPDFAKGKIGTDHEKAAVYWKYDYPLETRLCRTEFAEPTAKRPWKEKEAGCQEPLCLLQHDPRDLTNAILCTMARKALGHLITREAFVAIAKWNDEPVFDINEEHEKLLARYDAIDPVLLKQAHGVDS